MRPIMLVIAALFAAAALPSFAQNSEDGTPMHLRGTVVRLDGQSLVVLSREAQELSVQLAPDFKVSSLTKVDLAAIKQGDFIGTAAQPGTDGRLHAQEILLFPEA